MANLYQPFELTVNGSIFLSSDKIIILKKNNFILNYNFLFNPNVLIILQTTNHFSEILKVSQKENPFFQQIWYVAAI